MRETVVDISEIGPISTPFLQIHLIFVSHLFLVIINSYEMNSNELDELDKLIKKKDYNAALSVLCYFIILIYRKYHLYMLGVIICLITLMNSYFNKRSLYS